MDDHHHIAGVSTQKLETVGPSDPIPQRKKKLSFDPETSVLPPASTMEPALQAKKRVEPPFAKTAPVKSMQTEPPIQSKKRSQGPPVSLSNGYHDGAVQEEYALLGNQDKFVQNIKYKMRNNNATRDISPPKQMKLQKEKENVPKRSSKPAPVVNTEQYRQPATPLAPRKPRDQSGDVIQQLKEEARKPKKVEHSPRLETKKQKESEPTLKVQPQNADKVTRSEIEVRKSRAKITEESNMNWQEPVKTSMKAKTMGNMNEFAQTNMDKGITDSAAEAPADYALKYKTGIAPPRPTKKVSEYQKQFQWKKGLPASPLLKAEQVVYNSNPQLSPPKKDVIPKVTEYQKQFKPFRLVPAPVEEPVETPKKKSKLQRSKSLEDLTPTEIPTAGSAPVIAPDNRRLTMESIRDKQPEKAVPKVPQKKPRNVRSEYDSNFRAPTRFDYLRGSWHGARPPHVQTEVPEEVDRPATVPAALSNWFGEVLELRRKAVEYRKRAQGTHFSREHMVQLMAQQADMWDASTLTARSSSTLSALSLESGASSYRSLPPRQGQDKQKKYKDILSTAATCASDEEQTTGRLSDTDEYPIQQKLAWTSESPESPSTFSEESEPSCGRGRRTTPKLRDQLHQEGNVRRRHHLDRTTPTMGGALLSSPPRPAKKTAVHTRVVSKSVDSISQATGSVDDDAASEHTLTEEPLHKPIAGQKTYTAFKGPLAPTPTFGMPSRDSHNLRDDDASTDRPLGTQFVHSPQMGRRNKPGGLGVIDEGFGQTYNKARLDTGLPIQRRQYDVDDDVLSVSMQSIASSCSVASETLERARKRKEEFWGKTISAK